MRVHRGAAVVTGSMAEAEQIARSIEEKNCVGIRNDRRRIFLDKVRPERLCGVVRRRISTAPSRRSILWPVPVRAGHKASGKGSAYQ